MIRLLHKLTCTIAGHQHPPDSRVGSFLTTAHYWICWRCGKRIWS